MDLEVGRGELISIMGASGCGKTTLLNCLSGLDSIDSGEIVIGGVPLSSMTDNERTDYRAANMGFVFQLYNLLPVLTSVENVELPMLISGRGLDWLERRQWMLLIRLVLQSVQGIDRLSSRAVSVNG